jgi:4-amino-4-deoxy-L-arabinose transferase-like glycosyltransferase
MKLETDAAGSSERSERPDGGTVWLPALLLSALAILLRILVATRREGIEIDGITYLGNAYAMARDWRTINVLHPPLYSLVLMPFLGLWRDPEWGARVVSAVLGGLWVWPTLWLARDTTDERVAWTAGLLVAVMPAAVEASTRVLPEATFGLCLAGLLVALLRALRSGGLGWACLVGILGGLATLARPEGMSYLVLAGALLATAPVLIGPPWSAGRALTRTATAAAVWLILLLPYMALVHHQTGHWNWSGKLGITLLWAESVGEERSHAVVEQVITETRKEDVPPSVLGYIAAHPKEVARRIVINLHLMDKYTLPGLLQSGGIALVFLGLVHLRLRRPPAPPEWFLAAALLPLAGFLLFVVEWRYFVEAIPVLCIIAAVGLARAGRPAPAGPPGRLSRFALLLLCVVVLSFVPWISRPWLRQDPAAVEKAAGLWLRRTAGPGALFIGRYPVITHYAEAQMIPFARRSLEEALAGGRKAGARFLIVDSVRLPESRPDLLWLVAGERVRRDLEVAHVVEDRAGQRVVIYRIAGGPTP